MSGGGGVVFESIIKTNLTTEGLEQDSGGSCVRASLFSQLWNFQCTILFVKLFFLW